jgi:hypothetical protein
MMNDSHWGDKRFSVCVAGWCKVETLPSLEGEISL